jgi:uncharacterized protein YdiU (UPF0061 family)
MHLGLEHHYAALPARLHANVAPTRVSSPRLIVWNDRLATELGWAEPPGDPQALAEIFGGARIAEDARPIALAYAGHQFGNFVPQLGDGRAILLGERRDVAGVLRDVQLKGAGPTPWSRGGDGRSALGPALREYAVSEAMAALGVPTTRSLAVVSTGEPVARERLLPGAVLTRVARSHVRVGTFEYFAARDDQAAIDALIQHVVPRLHPALANAERPALALLERVCEQTGALVARWLSVGFIHGVMNTDNTSIAAETLDYGPCAFLDEFAPGKVFSSIDRGGRYAYDRQPAIALWNLTRFAETLLARLGDDRASSIANAEGALARFGETFDRAWAEALRAKLGLLSDDQHDEDEQLARALLTTMAAVGADFTRTFRALSRVVLDGASPSRLTDELGDDPRAHEWLLRYRARLAVDRPDEALRRARMTQANPVIVPRNHQIEAVIAAAVDDGDEAPFHRLCEALARPFDPELDESTYARAPAAHERVQRTFCGT